MQEQEFREIYDRYYLRVMKVAMEILKDYHLAQDVCQEVFFQMGRNWDRIHKDMAGTYLIMYAHWRAVDCWRKCRRYKGMDNSERVNDIAGRMTPDKEVECREFQKRLFWELERKNPEWSELVIRLVFGNESPREVAREKGITVSSLRRRLSRARAWMRKKFRADFPDF